MPELPEVETVVRQLAPVLRGRTVHRLSIHDPRLRSSPTPRLAGRRIGKVSRWGKQIAIEFRPRSLRGRPLWLAIHLRMTGRLLWNGTDGPPAEGHLRACLRLDRGCLSFVDPRRFGTFQWLRRPEERRPGGVDPLTARLTASRLASLLDGSRQNVKAWLLRQDRLVGVGNIYASEVLHAARISPLRRAGELTPAEIGRLLRALRRILTRAIEHSGTTFSDFQDSRGLTGAYRRYLAVYDREGRPCRRCRAPVARLVQQQRSTYHCPGCQV